MKAILRFRQKVTLVNPRSLETAVAELKAWAVPRSAHYPEGLKYSLFLVLLASGRVVVGFDNHQPKGPHLHVGDEEVPYEFRGIETLVEDFWDLVQEKGFQ